ncbi:MAG: leucine--tRNA ligase [Minisyncoccales bacterium]
MKYNHRKVESKWQVVWEEREIFKTSDSQDTPKFYCLDMFPYPSGSGLHVGHPRGYMASDIISRYKKMKGFNVLHPMGWDAFGLPAENHALKTGIQPQISTEDNIARFKNQIRLLGLSYDWTREINTTDPKYYKWTQWIFIKLFEKGLAYESNLPINWCPSCKTGLANEEVVNGECERCGTKVGKKDVRQWVLKITKYADRLLNDLDLLDWPEKIKEMQRNWIGRSEGADIIFKSDNEDIKIFTTRPDTIFGATLLILAPEHPFIKKKINLIQNGNEVKRYIEQAKEKTDIERSDITKEKTGVEMKGLFAVNPANGENIPIWVADYVLSSYGYGAIMSVPAHDDRDYEFAKKHGCQIREVISGSKAEGEIYTGYGELINSGIFNGISSSEAIPGIIKWLGGKGLAQESVNYKIRDWVFSRQRYWGEPIPLVHCEKCGIVPVPEKDLPVILPEVEQYQPTGTGESPLAAITDWVNTDCPVCSRPAKRETNTMPQWAGSCWYYLRYIDPDNEKELVDLEKERYFMPVDLYIGGAEHAVLHLLYARFWHKFLYDIGKVSTVEPFQKLKNQGLILAEGGQKMSKSKGNVVSPDEMVKNYGSDALRLYEMFIGPFEESASWSEKGIIGVRRFLEKVWKVKVTDEDKGCDRLLHKTIKKVSQDIDNFKFNTAVSAFMILINDWSRKEVSKGNFAEFLKIFYPFAPHITEELWESLGNNESIIFEKWPDYDPDMAEDLKVNFIVQINGKVRDLVEIDKNMKEEEIKEIVFQRDKVKKWIDDKKVIKTIFVENKLINIICTS